MERFIPIHTIQKLIPDTPRTRPPLEECWITGRILFDKLAKVVNGQVYVPWLACW
jgi:hypothetical protein